jgi:hypothetical protein
MRGRPPGRTGDRCRYLAIVSPGSWILLVQTCGQVRPWVLHQERVSAGRCKAVREGRGSEEEASGVHRLRPHLALITLLVLITAQPVVAQSGGGTSFTSDDGLVTLVVPNGSVPEGTDITVSYRSSDEAPPELSQLLGGRAPSHYAIDPMGLTFDPPASFIRRVPLTMLDSSAEDPQVMGMLAIVDDTGAWSWASDLGFVIDAAAESLELSGDVTGGGRIFAIGGGVVWPGVVGVMGSVGYEEVREATFNIQSFLGLPSTYEGHGASVTAIYATTGDAGLVTVGQPNVSDVDDIIHIGLPYECLAPGETSTSLAFTLDGVGDDRNITARLELPATAVAVEVIGSIECLA